MYQTDEALGQKIHAKLKALKIESPIADKPFTNPHSASINGAMWHTLALLGLNTDDPSIKETPKRVEKMYREELFYGLDYKNFPKCTTTPNSSLVKDESRLDAMKEVFIYDELVVENGITIHSMCEHHFIPFIGTATIAYLPSSHLLGLSKLNRVADFFARRPQVQERLTAQIFTALCTILGTNDIGVIIKCQHMCVKLRGIKHQNCDTVTSKLGGRLLKPEVRNELLHLAGQV